MTHTAAKARHGSQGEVGHGGAWQGLAWRGMAVMANHKYQKGNANMVYQWKIPLMPVDAQTAGEELERIYNKHGALEPEDVVNENRAENAPLHSCFEWNDEVAAEKYRVTQAATIIRAITVTATDESGIDRESRAFVHVQKTYHPLTVVVTEKDMLLELLLSARREMECFCEKYRELEQLSPVIAAMAKALAEGEK